MTRAFGSRPDRSDGSGPAAGSSGSAQSLGLPPSPFLGACGRASEQVGGLDTQAASEPIDNVEGITLGPRLPDGRRAVVLVSDDNFNPAQTTQFIAAQYQRQYRRGSAGNAPCGTTGAP